MSDPHAAHDHDHDHAHGIGHVHAPVDFGRAFAIGIGLNAAFVIIEAGFGYFANSVALISDAGHNLSDVLGLVVAWVATHLAKRPPNARYTYGLRGSSILAALFNAVFLLIAVGAVGWEALNRLLHPEPVAGMTVLVVAAIGILVNGGTAMLFMSGSKNDLNIRGAYLHMAADAAVSVGVVIAGLVIILTGWQWLDPIVSLLINVVIIATTWGMLRESLAMSLNAVPRGIELAKVRNFLEQRAGVTQIHDLHVWPMSTTETALTAHLRMPAGHPGDHFLLEVSADLGTRFGIRHTTLQIEVDGATVCALEPEHVV